MIALSIQHSVPPKRLVVMLPRSSISLIKRLHTRAIVVAARFFFITVVVPLILLILGSFGARPDAQTIKVKLVNGRTGLPIAGTCVNVWVGTEHKAAVAIPTDNNGVAALRLTDQDGEIDVHNRLKGCGDFGVVHPVVKYDDVLQINVGYVLCQPGAADYSWLAKTNVSTKEVLQRGIVTANTCGRATASPEPGQVILFVRPLSWWEKLKQ